MAELVAEGRDAQDRWRISLLPGRTYCLGRDPGADLCAAWDQHISRRHVELIVKGNRLSVRRLPETGNPLYFSGKAVESCEIQQGQHFVLGSTRFLLTDAGRGSVAPVAAPVEQMTFSHEALQHVRYRDPDRRIEVLSHLPQVIWGVRTDLELHMRLVNLLLAGIPQAEAAALVAVDAAETIRVLHADRRRETAGPLRPSARLVTDAVVRRKQSVLHVWESPDQPADFTVSQGLDWAFCTPVAGPPSERWGLYLAGRFDAPPGSSRVPSLGSEGVNLQADVKFAELVAEIVGSVRKLNQLERQQAGLRQFFPPVILAALSEDTSSTLLAPRESDVTILFCDLRGFSRRAEGSRHDLIGLLDRVSQALGVMTRQILDHGGVVGDFQGDAAMGFWGWPVASDEAPLQACLAALGIRNAFAATAGQPGHPLADFEMGIGMAHGRAVAGKIGTSEHVKVTVFGPVVNLASRLEGMTKQLRVPILMDEALWEIVHDRLPPAEGRTRRLARVLPYGMETPVLVSELLPSEKDAPELTAAHLAAYESAVEHFIAGEWEEAYRNLHDLPTSDRAQDFLTVLIAQHNRIAPPDWKGVVELPNK